MTVFVTKTSEDYWYDFKSFDTIESLFDFVNENDSIIIQRNSCYYKEKPSDLMRGWKGMSIEDAEKISNSKYTIEIYDTWRE